MKPIVAAHSISLEVLATQLRVDTTQGLSANERTTRGKTLGLNELPKTADPTIFHYLWAQIANPIVVILVVAAGFSAISHQVTEAILIYAIVLMMTILGVLLESQAQKSLKALRAMHHAETIVLSQGKHLRVATASIVPGDCIVVSSGHQIPADARVISAQDAYLDESALTGESVPTKKHHRVVPTGTIMADQHNMVFAGTMVVGGSLTALVVATGKQTELGKLADSLEKTTPPPTPLQAQLEKIGTWLLVVTAVSTSALLSLSVWRGESWLQAISMSTAMAIAFIPESLTAIMTITLASAVKTLVAKKAIVRRLFAVEGLGSITHIITDKTGTLTQGNMHVTHLYLGNKLWSSSDPKLKQHAQFTPFMEVLQFCNNNQGPTEAALVAFLEKHHLQYEWEGRAVEFGFTSATKRMSVIRQHEGELRQFSKGAPDVLVPLCTTHVGETKNQDRHFSVAEQTRVLAIAEELAKQGFRVLAVADKTKNVISSHSRSKSEQQLRFLGLLALMDPLRPSVAETVKGLRVAGIVPVVMSGDHPAIVAEIGRQAGIILPHTPAELQVIHGQELDDLLANQLKPEIRQRLMSAAAFARVRPDQKTAMVEFLASQGARVAMAGDGINDAAAVKKAQIGIAMSNGTDLTQDIADIVLTGSYKTILEAVKVGRLVKYRLQLYLHFLLSDNSSLWGVFAISLGLSLPHPVTPLIALLINLLTDALPALAMAMEPEPPRFMKEHATLHYQPLLSTQVQWGIAIQGTVVAVLLGGVFAGFLWWWPNSTLPLARSMVFTTYVWLVIWRCFTARSLTQPIRVYGWFSNKIMNMAIVGVIGSWAVVTYLVPQWFALTALPWYLVVFALALSPIPAAIEALTKWYWTSNYHLPYYPMLPWVQSKAAA